MASDDSAQPAEPPADHEQQPSDHDHDHEQHSAEPSRSDGPFVLRTLLEDVPLSADGSHSKVRINCVDFYDGNLYVGTSESELLHFVQIPPDPADPASRPSFILASRLQPPYAALPEQAPKPGVQQLVLLPNVGKAAILCNFTVTFYLLPELSPTTKGVQVKNVGWIGGPDLDEREDIGGGDTLMLALSRRLRVVRLRDDDARVMRTIDFGGSVNAVRRGTIACVADARNYALLDIDRQLKIPLMSISSLDDSQPAGEIGHAQPIAVGSGNDSAPNRGHNSRPSSLVAPFQGHSRNSSLTGFLGNAARRQDGRGPDMDVMSLFSPSPPPPSQNPRPPPAADGTAETPRSAATTPTPQDRPRPPPPPLLKPHTASPTPEEFLLVTGTKPTEPGIGMFINLDGDATRPPLEFETYPFAVAVEQQADLLSSRTSVDDEEDGYVFASLAREVGDSKDKEYGIEVQRWSAGAGAAPSKFWLQAQFEGRGPSGPYGVRAVVGAETAQFPEIVEKLGRAKFSPFARTTAAPTPPLERADSRTALSLERVKQEKELFERDADSQDDETPPEGWEARRNGEEREFARRLAGTTAKMAIWADGHIWWAIRNPALLQLESALDKAAPAGAQAILQVLASFRGRDARSELEFMTYNYVRQRAGILLLVSLLRAGADTAFDANDMAALEAALVESELDPRVVLCLVPGLCNEIMVGRRGMWIFGGVKEAAERYLDRGEVEKAPHKIGSLGVTVLTFLRRFLLAWRRKKGFGSVDDRHVFGTVDAALLAVVLELDRLSPPGAARAGSVRQELYEIVDGGVDCFDRAASLLESSHRLYVLSRLYQSRKMAGNVLATWRRILEGERDDGGEFDDGERRVREYLAKVGNQALVQEYGLWLAGRNPKLGVQVFADETNRAPRFDAARVVALLRREAPGAVKYYLEHLVFGRGHSGYVNDLIGHYLGVVVDDIESSSASREAYRLSAETYRALRAPKPTFHHFLAANAPAAGENDEPWQSRLRLLQLLGGAADYDAAGILARIGRVADADSILVPEMIILAGRDGRHQDALRLLVHRLGDHDTAVAYCLGGGSTIYGATVPRLRGPAAPSSSSLSPSSRKRLFRTLLGEFLTIADPDERQTQTGMLLDRFGTLFDVDEVLALVPDGWGVGVVEGFLVGALRGLVAERREMEVVTALRQAENVRVAGEWLARMEEVGGVVEMPDSGVDLNG